MTRETQLHLRSGEIAFCEEPATIHTDLGSCVAVCIWDQRTGAGGMCHYLLPEPIEGGTMPPSRQHGAIAIVELLGHFQATGSSRDDLRAKVVGGSERLTRGRSPMGRVGERNVEVALRTLAEFSVLVVGMAVGGTVGRRMRFRTDNGALRFRSIRRLSEFAPPPDEVNRHAVQSRTPRRRVSAKEALSRRRERRLTLGMSEEALKRWVVVVGSSSRGAQVVQDILTRLPQAMPPVLLVQHMPRALVSDFARRLGDVCAGKVHEAMHGMVPAVGNIYVAPGDRQMRIVGGSDGRLVLKVVDDTLSDGFRPSANHLFRSAALLAQHRVMGVLLSGMGADGAKGLRCLKDAGAVTITEGRGSNAVFRMPGKAKTLGAVRVGTPANQIAAEMLTAMRTQKQERGPQYVCAS